MGSAQGADPPASAAPAANAEGRIVVAADRDDDDLDGKPDGEQPVLPPLARADLVVLDRALVGAELRPSKGAERARIIVQGKPWPWGKAVPAGAMVQGIAPGFVSGVAVRGGKEQPLAIEVRAYGMRDGAAADVDFTRDHASLERTPPARVADANDARYDDPDALRVFLELPLEASLPADVYVASIGAGGTEIESLRVPITPVPCRAQGSRCGASAPLRFVIDEVDQKHPLVRERSLRAEVGGAIVLRNGARKMQAIRVLGPRASPVGPLARYRAVLRPVVLRVTPGGTPAIGGSDAGAVALLRAEVALAAAAWGQCGLSFGAAASIDVKIIDPPPSHLIAVGDDMAVPASGGEARFRVDGREMVVPIASGWTADRAADAIARAVTKAGLVAVVSANARIAPGAAGSVDVSVRRRDGRLASVDASGDKPITTDATLSVRIGSVDLSDGLQHFGDMDSVAGTLEERTLIKAVDDGDPRTIEVVVIPFFAGGGRIGESFIASDFSSVRNAVLLDRAGIRARRSSLTLAHELGHVFMDMPGHPDDYGIDTPTLLMDSDGSDSSPFGPRRITVDECARVFRQAGPGARVPLLEAWPLTPLRY
jgi:hypothetical protein